ncbi:inositol transporter 4 [Ricinus communis]|uniref:Sugar transporter, putative n=1 Tax=Ricinus communis TaxID=3988 RepID=B9SG58_RICCO|nr:inositol transporter 4 [Ricinus communis]XP_015578321.1 inositol transporter 4 [Ricinus communis]EEF37384.1 sugar transporter, putative [Ricinus communis]|eukprot:XP_002524977.1 inositol transporter 4 [Ricinus communis]
MVEGAVIKPDKTEFKECWKMIWETPYIMRLALSAGIGGFLFGYDTANISGALLYIREDFESVNKNTWLQETIVSMTVAGAIVGAACGGYMNDRFGRKSSILFADAVFFIGALVMAIAPAPWVIILGRVLVGIGVGIASVTSPLYISETSHAKIRGALVSINGLLLTTGQFLSYLINLALTKAPGTWRWMLGVAGIPAVVQIFLMLLLPESPRWLYRQNRVDEARRILEKIYSYDEVDKEITALALSVEAEKADEASIGEGMISKVTGAFKNTVVRRGLYAGITVQVAQQFVGINTIMYYAPTIVQFAGFASKSMALSLSLITSGLNAVGTILSMGFVDRFGRRRLMIISMIGIIISLVATSVVFMEASAHAPKISSMESLHFGPNSTCPNFVAAPDPLKWNCMSCLNVDCGFCSNSASIYHPGACLRSTKALKSACGEEHRVFFEQGCPSRFGFPAVILLALYIVIYAFGMGTVPWIVNSEIYPLRYRGVGGGIAAVSNWVANLIVSESYLTMTEHLGAGGTFLLFAAVSSISLLFIYRFVPETRGLKFEDVEKMLEKGYKPGLCGGGSCGGRGKGEGREEKGVDSV